MINKTISMDLDELQCIIRRAWEEGVEQGWWSATQYSEYTREIDSDTYRWSGTETSAAVERLEDLRFSTEAHYSGTHQEAGQ